MPANLVSSRISLKSVGEYLRGRGYHLKCSDECSSEGVFGVPVEGFALEGCGIYVADESSSPIGSLLLKFQPLDADVYRQKNVVLARIGKENNPKLISDASNLADNLGVRLDVKEYSSDGFKETLRKARRGNVQNLLDSREEGWKNIKGL